MKKSEFVEKLKRTIRMSAARSESTNRSSEERLDMLVADILETMAQNKIKPPKWMQQRPQRMADGSTRMINERWRFNWEPESGTISDPLQDPLTEMRPFPPILLDGPGDQTDEEEG